MADAPDLGSGSERSGGSSPLARTKNPASMLRSASARADWAAQAPMTRRKKRATLSSQEGPAGEPAEIDSEQRA